jgi:hypothetical protein
MGHLTVTAPTTELAIARALEYRTAATAPADLPITFA